MDEEEPEEPEEPEDSIELQGATHEGDEMKAVADFLESQRIDQWNFMSFGGSPAHHYTDLAGLLGIVNDDDLWLTNARYSNDEAEIRHGYEIALSVVRNNKDMSQADMPLEYLEELESALNNSVRALEGGGAGARDCYICCFCAGRPGLERRAFGDLLSQWRGYAGYGAGVSLELEISRIPAIWTECRHGRFYYWMVRYVDGEKTERIEEIVQYFAQRAGPPSVLAKRAAESAAACIDFFVPTFKDEAFIDEREWRLIFVPSLQLSRSTCPRPGGGDEPAGMVEPPHICYRVRRSLLVPYYRLKDFIPSTNRAGPRLPILGVTVGPGPHKGLIAENVRRLLEQKGHPPNVNVSNVPFRG